MCASVTNRLGIHSWFHSINSNSSIFLYNNFSLTADRESQPCLIHRKLGLSYQYWRFAKATLIDPMEELFRACEWTVNKQPEIGDLSGHYENTKFHVERRFAILALSRAESIRSSQEIQLCCLKCPELKFKQELIFRPQLWIWP